MELLFVAVSISCTIIMGLASSLGILSISYFVTINVYLFLV